MNGNINTSADLFRAGSQLGARRTWTPVERTVTEYVDGIELPAGTTVSLDGSDAVDAVLTFTANGQTAQVSVGTLIALALGEPGTAVRVAAGEPVAAQA
jgi:hypothetical protein